MALTLTNTTLTDPADKSEVEANFTDVANKFGNITNADLSGSAGITAANLAVKTEHMVVTLKVLNDGNQTDTSTVNGLEQVDLSNVADNTILDFVPIPGTTSEANWTLDAASYACNDTGDGNTTVSVEWGSYSSGSWVTTTTNISEFAITSGGGANTIASGSMAFHATNVMGLALRMGATAGSGTVSNAGSFLILTCKLSRTVTA